MSYQRQHKAVLISLREETVDRLSEITIREGGRSRTSIIRMAIDDWLEKNAPIAPTKTKSAGKRRAV